jgi:hypothetical protein
MRPSSEPNTPMTVLVGIGFALLLFLTVVILEAYFYRAEENENAKKVVAVAPEELAQLRAQHENQLNSYRWVDEKKGIVAIPIERAMKLVVRDLAAGRPVIAAPPATPTPAPKKGKSPPPPK